MRCWAELGLGADGDDGAATSSASTPPGSSSPSSTPPPSAPAPKPTNIYRDILPGRFSPAVRGVPERVYVPNSESGTVDVIDPPRSRIRRFPVGALAQHVTPAWNMRRLYVDNTTGNTLTRSTPHRQAGRRTIPVADPYNLYFTPDGTKAIVVAGALRRLDFRDPHTWKLIKSVHDPLARGRPPRLQRRGRDMLASTRVRGMGGQGRHAEHEVTGELDVGGSPVDVKLAPDGSVFYVANQGTGGVIVGRSRRMKKVGFIHTGGGAHGLVHQPRHRSLYVTQPARRDHLGDRLRDRAR